MPDDHTHPAQEVMIARQELGNVMHLLNELTDKVVLVAALLNKAYDQSQQEP